MIANFEHLYREHAPALLRYATSLTRTRAEAEDLVSDTFLRAWAAPTDWQAPTLRAYLFRILRNLFLADRRRPVQFEELSGDRASSQDPELDAGARLEFQRLQQVLPELNEVDRAALLLHSLGGLTYGEIAAVLGIPAGTLKVKVHRARIRLAELISQPIATGEPR